MRNQSRLSPLGVATWPYLSDCLRAYLDTVGIAQNSGTVQNVDRELLRERVWLIAHQNPHPKSAHFRVFGDRPGAWNRLRQATNRQADRVLCKREVMAYLGRISRLRYELRPEDVEVLDPANIAFNQSA